MELAEIGSNTIRAIEGWANRLKDKEGYPKLSNIHVVKEAYYNEYSMAERKTECKRVRDKYPDRLPVICERAFNANIAQVDKRKFLVPRDLTVGQFLYVIRSRMKLGVDEALFVFVNGQLPPTGELMQQLYNDHHSDDGFLYFTYNGENTFG
jgi:GABA(A) receptor-associated protein